MKRHMQANIIKVGNSKGIIIPAKFLKLLGLSETVRIDVEDNRIVIEPIEDNLRKDWEIQFAKASSLDDKEILMPEVFDDENIDDWKW